MVHVHRSTIVDAPVDQVWAFLCKADRLGAVHTLALSAGGRLREQLIALSDRDRTLTYAILDSPLPLFGYVATMRARPVTDGARAFVEWWSDFETTVGREDELAGLIARDIYDAGFDAVKRAFGQRAPVRPPATPPGVLPSRTRAVVIERYGGPEVLLERELALPPPGPGEVTIRHTAIGLNYIDVYCRTGYFRLVEPPGVPGMEAAGVIEAVGAGVHAFREGDRVGYAAMPPGAYAERRTMAADLLVLLPDSMSDEEAAAGLLKGMTAEFLIHRIARLREGDTVLVHAAVGGVGLILCQWARAIGATVIGTVSTEEKAALARRNGCVYPIVAPRDGVAERVREITKGAGCRAVFDAVGRDTIATSIECLGVRGHLVSYGQASGHIDPVDIAGLASRSLTISRPNFGDYAGTPEEVRSITDRLFAAHAKGEIRFEARQRFQLADAAAAHRALESRATMGSTILIP